MRNRSKSTTTTPPRIVRQGDVLLIAVAMLPAGLVTRQRENGAVVLAHGEVTGHAHSIAEKAVIHYDAPNAAEAARQLLADAGLTVEVAEQNAPTFLEVTEPAELVHQEHGTIPLDKGRYVVLRQVEYSPEALRTVAD